MLYNGQLEEKYLPRKKGSSTYSMSRAGKSCKTLFLKWNKEERVEVAFMWDGDRLRTIFATVFEQPSSNWEKQGTNP